MLAGVLAGLDALHGTGIPAPVVGLATALEGHPDNASAGVLGGFCVSRTDPATGSYLDTQRFEVPDDVAFVVVSPPVELVTKESRGALPASLPFFDAVRSINSAAYIVAAFATRDYASLRFATGDLSRALPASADPRWQLCDLGGHCGWSVDRLAEWKRLERAVHL